MNINPLMQGRGGGGGRQYSVVYQGTYVDIDLGFSPSVIIAWQTARNGAHIVYTYAKDTNDVNRISASDFPGYSAGIVYNNYVTINGNVARFNRFSGEQNDTTLNVIAY